MEADNRKANKRDGVSSEGDIGNFNGSIMEVSFYFRQKKTFAAFSNIHPSVRKYEKKICPLLNYQDVHKTINFQQRNS